MIILRRSLRRFVLTGLVALLSWNVSMAQKAPVRSLDHRDGFERGERGQAPVSKTRPALRVALIDEMEPNNTVEQAQVLSGALPVTVDGMAEIADLGNVTVNFSDSTMDDLEDLYQITTSMTGLSVSLDGFSSDCDLWLLTAEGDSALAASLAEGTTVEDPDNAEEINFATLPPGTYLIGVTIFDPEPIGGDTTAYTLTVSELMVDPGGSEAEPNNDPSTAQALGGDLPITVDGSAEVADEGNLTINFNDGTMDDVEDLFAITTTAVGLRINLDNFTSDCDIYLLNDDATTILEESNTVGAGIVEEIVDSDLPVGTYFIGVTIYDLDPGGADSTSYRLTISNPTATAIDDEPGVPAIFALAQNYPNPFNPETRIAYDLPTPATVQLDVFNMLGQKIRTLVAAEQPPGRHTVVWDGRDESGLSVATGVYVYRLATSSFETSRVMVLLR